MIPGGQIWFTAAGVTETDLAQRPGTSMGSQASEANAAMAGQGVAILTPAFVATELADGRLIQPFELVCNDGHAYWLVYPEARRNAAEDPRLPRLAAGGGRAIDATGRALEPIASFTHHFVALPHPCVRNAHRAALQHRFRIDLRSAIGE